MQNKDDRRPQKGELFINDPLGDLKKILSDRIKEESKETAKKSGDSKK